MNTVKVVATVKRNSLAEEKTVFAMVRGYRNFSEQQEFPSRKTKVDETSKQALVREIQEKLDANISAGGLIGTME